MGSHVHPGRSCLEQMLPMEAAFPDSPSPSAPAPGHPSPSPPSLVRSISSPQTAWLANRHHLRPPGSWRDGCWTEYLLSSPHVTPPSTFRAQWKVMGSMGLTGPGVLMPSVHGEGKRSRPWAWLDSQGTHVRSRELILPCSGPREAGPLSFLLVDRAFL